MTQMYEPNSRIISAEQCAKNAVFFFFIVALFLHIKYGGLAGLLSLKAAIYFIVGMFAASLTIGVLMYAGNRFLEVNVFQRHPNFRGIGSTIFLIALLVLLYKGCALGYFWLNPTHSKVTWTESDRGSSVHFQSAKQSAEQLWAIMEKVGQPGVPQPRVTPDQLRSLVTGAIRESSQVEDGYLAKVHPDLPTKYRTLFVASLDGVSTFFSTQNEQAITDAMNKYGQYVDWINAHYRDFRLMK